MIIRTWRGVVRAEDAEQYVEYVRETGLRSYASTPGNRGSWIWRRPVKDGALVELLVCSRWDSMDAVRGFAGEDVERAVFYPQDDRHLVERDEFVLHYEEAAAE